MQKELSSFQFCGYNSLVAITFHPRTGREGPEVEYKCSFTLSLTPTLDGVGG